jgi:branched-chain amino acid transport system permease protein
MASLVARATASGKAPSLWRALPYLVLAVLALLPFWGSSYVAALFTQALIYAIFAMSLDLILGYTGLLSFGHAAFFGLGAYGVVVLSVQFGLGVWTAALCALALSAGAAALIGFFCVRISGVAFLMLTMAFAQLLNSAAVTWRGITGGTDGLAGAAQPALFGVSLSDPMAMYWFAFVAFLVACVFLRHIVRAPIGHVFVGIRENEARMQAIGYPVRRYKLASFVLGGLVAGFAGVVFALYNNFVSTDLLDWGTSGDVILMVILGGTGTLAGPAVGAFVFLLLKEYVSAYTEHWQIVVGTIFILCMMVIPDGIYGTLDRRLRKIDA